MNPILPPSTLGLVGGGQLGRMTALAARSAGYRVHALDPDPKCSIRPLVEYFIAADWNDVEAAAGLARTCEVVTFEIEKVSVASLEGAARYAPVRPGPAVLHLIQNRLRQKLWLSQTGFPVGAFRPVTNLEDLRNASRDLGPCFVKVAEGGYDGRGQIRLALPAQADSAWNYLGALESVAEKALDLDYEVSVLVARRPRGETRVYPASMNHHENQILVWSVIPAPIPVNVALQAQKIAHEIAAALPLEGVLVVEMFVSREGGLFVNELAPRPHNSYHASERACVTGQFEQLVRAVCDLPLGSAEVIRPAAIVNLFGELWGGPSPLDWTAALRVPEVRLHIYDKTPRPGRKMGHISATGSTPQQALQSALRAKLALNGREESGVHTADMFTEGTSVHRLGTRGFARAVIERLGELPKLLKPARYAARQTDLLSRASTPWNRKPPLKKELVGVDVFLHWRQGSPDNLGAALKQLDNHSLQLLMITNRGVKVWPDGQPETFYTDHWRCRFMHPKNTNISHRDIIQLLNRVEAAGLDFIKAENLCNFDGVPGYALGQGQ